MFTCYGCRCLFQSTVELVKHMRSACLNYRNIKEFRCGEPNCIRHFSTGASLKKHLVREHASKANRSVNNTPSTSESFSPVVFDSHSQPEATSSNSTLSVQHTLANFVSSMYSKNGVPRNVVQMVSVEVSKLLSESKNVILTKIYENLDQKNITIDPETKATLQNVLEEYSSTMFSLNTEYKRFQYFENLGTFIPPSEITIGQRMELRESGLQPIPCTMQIIPIANVLKNLLTLSGVMNEVLRFISSFKSPSGYIENIMQGQIWLDILRRETDDNSSLKLPLILFYDDFETGNPLGSHSSVHKLGGVYLSLPFLPAHYASKLQNILMLALFHTSDRIEFGNNVVFQKVFDQLNNLQITGVHVTTDGFDGIVKFYIVSLTGDNLGLNGVLGFVESFVANKCCRICSANKSQMHSMLYEDTSLLRTRPDYESDILLCDSKLTGVKEKCVFIDNLKGFDLFDHVAVDLLHDFLEGTCRYVMDYVVNFLVVESKLIALSTVQNKIKYFNYGPDSSSKPLNCIILDGTKIKVKTSAAEMLTLVRYFPVMFGFYIPSDCQVWALFLYLRKILDRLINPKVNENSSCQLKFWIAGLNELYCKIAKTHLKPKFHFMIHYPSMMLKFGPLTQIWTMRFEAKHRLSKITARSSCSKTNLCKTVALKNQLVLNDVFLKNDAFSSVTSGKKTDAQPRVPYDQIVGFNLQHNVQFRVKWVMIQGQKISVSSVLTVDLCTETFDVLFGQVTEIYLIDGRVFFSIWLYETVGFNEHYFAYKVCVGTKHIFIESESLMSCVPNTITTIRDSSLYITLRMPID